MNTCKQPLLMRIQLLLLHHQLQHLYSVVAADAAAAVVTVAAVVAAVAVTWPALSSSAQRFSVDGDSQQQQHSSAE